MRRGRVAVLVVSCLLGVTGLTVATTSLSHADGTSPTGGALYGFGYNNFGQVGTGDLATPSSPAAVSISALPAGTAFATVSAASEHSCALSTEGKPYCWGANWQGQLGDGTTTNRASPTPVSVSALPVQTFTSITAGSSHTCAITTAGTPYCWGDNTFGKLGTADGTGRTSPSAVSISALPVQTFSSISPGINHTCALTTTGVAYCWGYNSSRQLGDGTGTNRSSPSAVAASGTTFSAVAAGNNHSCALTAAGTPYCWGTDYLGVAATGQTATPMAVSISALPVQTFVAINVANQHSCILSSTGEPYCWGGNWSGQLGTGDTALRGFPTAVSASALPVQTFSSLSTSSQHSCAIATTGVPYCWGGGADNRLGTGDTTNRLVPTPVSVSGLAAQTYRLISAGGRHTLLLSATTTPNAALTPAFDAPVATVDGFGVNVSNYDPAFTWTATTNTGTVITGSATANLWPITISGLSPGTTATLTITTTRTGYNTGSATVSVTSQATSPAEGVTLPDLLPPIISSPVVTTAPSTPTAPPGTTPPPESAPTNPIPRTPPTAATITALPIATLTDSTVFQPGTTVTVTANGFTPNEPVTLIIASTPRIIATGNADAAGTARLTGTIPLDVAPGDHTLAIYAPNSDTGRRQTITVSAPRLPATGTDPTSLVALAMLAFGTLLLSLSRRRQQQ